jgi:hypothetical protein
MVPEPGYAATGFNAPPGVEKAPGAAGIRRHPLKLLHHDEVTGNGESRKSAPVKFCEVLG